MELTFYLASAVAVLSTIMVITRYNMVHALIYLIISFLAIAIVLFVLGAPFIAALEVIIYAGAIVVLIIFVIMMLNLRDETVQQEKSWLTKDIFIFPAILSAILLAEVIYIITSGEQVMLDQPSIDSTAVGMSLYGPYVIGVELCGILLMSGIVGAYHLGRQKKKIVHRFLEHAEQ
ncbi:MAG TPA: NADH-quinone oxidoreductase subunit J [Chryseosolibacter sp.]